MRNPRAVTMRSVRKGSRDFMGFSYTKEVLKREGFLRGKRVILF
jgi:hypothetical protein